MDALSRFAPRLLYDHREREFAVGLGGEPDVIYGRESDGWLDYWAFYLRDWSPVPWRRGHPFDWEGLVLQLGPDGFPVVAALAQHSSGEVVAWEHLLLTGEHPHVYVELGRHASRAVPSRHPLRPADGRGRAVVPAVEVMPADGWAGRGRWGGNPRSPRAPGLQRRFRDPAGWVAKLSV